MIDIAPELIDKVNKDFKRTIQNDKKLLGLKERLYRGEGSYKDAYDYAERVGKARAAAFKANLTADALPEGKMYFNIADRLMNETLPEDHALVTEYASSVQRQLNKKAKIGLNALEAELDEDRIKGFVEGVCNADSFEDVAWKLGEPVVTFARSVVDDTIKRNAEFQHKAGIEAVVERESNSKCCEWCADLAGRYVYPDVPREVFQRHDNCKCTVDYKGRRLTTYAVEDRNSIWGMRDSHTFRDQGETERIEARKQAAQEIERKQAQVIAQRRK